jgi:molybdate transport system substrate-binding protein
MPQDALKLLSSMATREVLAALALAYQQSTARPVVTEAAGGVDVAERVRGGERLDIVVLAVDVIDRLIAEGRLLQHSRVDLVKSGVAVAVRSGTSVPDISTEEAVKDAVLAAKSLSYSTGPSGVHMQKTFERWGILDQIRDRIVVPKPGKPVASLLADGSVQLGFQQTSELLNLAGIDILGPLPESMQIITVFSGGISGTSTQAEAARTLLDFLASPGTASIKQRYGMAAAEE